MQSTKTNTMIEAYIKLVLRHQTAKISVTEICQEAHISRNTFYYHFLDRFELLESIYTSDIEKPLLFAVEKNLPARESTIVLYRQFLMRKNFYMIVMKEEGQNSMFENIITHLEKINLKRMRPYIEDAQQLEYFAYRFAATQAMLLKKWLMDGMNQTPEFMSDIFTKDINMLSQN